MEPPREPTGVFLKKIWGVLHSPLFIASLFITILFNGLVTFTLLSNLGLFRWFCTILAACICFLIFGLFSLSQMAYNDGFFMVVGLGYGFVGISSLVSRAASDNLLENRSGRNVSLQILLIGRFIEIIAFLVALLLARKTFRGWIAPLCTFCGFLLLQAFFFSLILWWDIFPDCINEGGATQFRRIMEGTCLGLFFVIFLLIIYRSQSFSINVFVYLEFCLVLRMITSVFNVVIDDFNNGAPLILANLFRLVSFTYLFLSVGLSTFRNPMKTLFRNLDMKHMALENEKVIVAWMIEQVPAIAILLNETGTITHMNRYATKTLECQEISDDWTLQNFFDFFYFEEDEDAHRLFKALANNKLPNSILNLRSIRTKTEDNRIIEWTLKRVKTSTNVSTNPSSRSSRSDIEMQSYHSSQTGSTVDEDLSKLQILCLGQDITDKMEREKLLAKARNNAEKLSQMKDSFVANISHELRTPLNCIVGVTDLLQQVALAESQREMVSMIKIAANSLLSLINDLLDLAKMKQKGQIQLIYGSIDLRSFVESCIMSVAVLSQTGQAEFAYRIKKECPKIINNDEKRLRQVLFNLLSNAIKFTVQGQIVLKVDYITGNKSFYGPALEFQITDSGIGIKPTDLAHLFDRFFQADQGKLKKQGTGIGLTITKQLVELMGGTISATSEVGVGTTFKFVIPLNDQNHSDGNGHTVQEVKESNNNDSSEETTNPDQGGDTISQQPLKLHHVVLFYLQNQVVTSILSETISEDFGYETASFSSLEELNKNITTFETKAPKVLTVVLESEYLKNLNSEALQKVQKAGAWIQIVCVLSMSDYTVPSDAHLPDEFRVDSIRKIIQISTLTKLLRRARRKNTTTNDAPVLVAFNSNSPLVSSDDQKEDKIKEPEEIKELNILIVEDNMTNQKVMKLMLDQISHVHYDMAENGQIAVNLFLEKRYDCIFMDCQMPVMDGIEATQEIRRLEAEKTELGRTHITALTANAFADEKERCFSVGMDDYITKPISLRTFITKLDSLRQTKK